MNQRQWIYLGPYGRHNKIGLMHGADSGNVMIYYNDKIITIDFKVFESKKYKFFVDEKLCEVLIIKHKKQDSYRYEFKFDNKTKTDYNVRRNAAIKKSNIKGIIIVIGVPLLIASIVFGYTFFRKAFLEYQYNNNYKETWATIRVYTDGNMQKTFYFFRDQNNESVDSKRIPAIGGAKTPHGLPLEDGDIFAIKFVDKYTFYHKVDYNQPDEATALKIMRRIAGYHIQHNQGRMQQELLCEIQAAYDLQGMDGLAHILHQMKKPEKNKTYNQDSFLKLKRDSHFQQAVEKCWGEQVY